MFKAIYSKKALGKMLDLYFHQETPFYLILCNLFKATSVSINTSTGIISLPNHSLQLGERVEVNPVVGGLLPSNLSSNIDYYIIESSINSIKISASPTGVAIIPTATGIGQLIIKSKATTNHSVSYWTNRELLASSGYTRIPFIPFSSIITAATDSIPKATLPQVSPFFKAISDIKFNYLVLLSNALADVGSPLGEVVFHTYVGLKEIEAGSKIIIPIDTVLESLGL